MGPLVKPLWKRPDVWIPTVCALFLILWITTQGQPRALSQPLEEAAAVTATAMLQAVGAPSQLEGTRITTGRTYNDVTSECSGLEIMLAMALLTFTIGRLFGVAMRPTITAAVLMVGLAFVMNSLRIASISFVAWQSGVEVAWGTWHDASAYIAFGVTYAVMFLTLLKLRVKGPPQSPRFTS